MLFSLKQHSHPPLIRCSACPPPPPRGMIWVVEGGDFMSPLLKDDLNRFCRVYLDNMSDVLKRLPTPAAMKIKQELEEEFDLFQLSMFNRIEEEFTKQ